MKHTILVLFLIAGISAVSTASESESGGFGLRKISKTKNDTAKVNSYIRKGLAYDTKKTKIEYLKANIDTAELICVEDNIEFPSLLHLARAEYFFLIGDYRSASQDATIALKKSKSNGETEILAKTMSFLGSYCLRTGFFKESIDYFNNSNTLAKKNRLKGIIPLNYNRMKDVYDALGNQSEYRNSLRMLINAANDENDTIYLETGYYLLGTSLTSEKRDFRRADSLLRRSLELSLIKKDSAFITRSLSNLGKKI
jgi:tetratricopeptide (TPR) repeat protein